MNVRYLLSAITCATLFVGAASAMNIGANFNGSSEEWAVLAIKTANLKLFETAVKKLEQVGNFDATDLFDQIANSFVSYQTSPTRSMIEAAYIAGGVVSAKYFRNTYEADLTTIKGESAKASEKAAISMAYTRSILATLGATVGLITVPHAYNEAGNMCADVKTFFRNRTLTKMARCLFNSQLKITVAQLSGTAQKLVSEFTLEPSKKTK